jgi:hypothetical protein
MADDLRKLGVKQWRRKALDRAELASIIREAKAKLKGRSAIGRRRRIGFIISVNSHVYIVLDT